MLKKVFILFTAVMICFSLSIAVSAQSIPANEPTSLSIVEPYYEMANSVASNLSISGTTATCKSIIYGDDDVTKITVTQTLQKQGFLWIWGTYDNTTWTKTVYSSNATVSNQKTGLSSGKYRLKSVFTLTNSQGKTETITVYSDVKSVG